MPRSPARRVAVVGAGIAGLTLAAALGDDVEVTLHEARPERAGLGASLVLWPSALRALDRLGVRPLLGERMTAAGSGRVFDAEGRPLTRPHRMPLHVVERPDLLAALTASLPRRARLVEAEVDDPEELDADLVVGADGVRSRVRGLVDPRRAGRRGTPWVALRGALATRPAPADVGEYWGPGRLLGLVPSPAGGYWFATHCDDEGVEPLDVDTALRQAREVFSGAGGRARDVLASADPATTSATRLWTAPPLRRYASGRYVVVGDAAHAMTPNLGRGACDAVLDAVRLASALRSGRGTAGYEARRLPPTQAARVASGALMRLALLDRGSGARDRALRTVGAVRRGGRR
ncbi:FAD-dependent monooxygenase [Phycicoccus sp. BSK3Z-2]|uniref:FAD-dependent monooxygenase n=1 Tax=Phycicoccus avicenniae TaxID=2828860 RepID=A0A941D5R1_9MICO|nr:NAD(P)/FAD-dependent oxidoreductase [Phycicoccus avicenniae]MBR7742078.1 FAD-dependent monooxygenase [Phycicoccus avicenniae]